MKVSIIIKALNEQDNIKRAIESSIQALKGLTGEVILADSLSTDNTVTIAKKYPVKIVQLTYPQDRSCGVGPQLGYQYAKGEFIYILDGDMEFEKDFLHEAVHVLEKEKTLAGVAGMVTEMQTDNMVFARRKNSKKIYGVVDKLEMGGLYRRKALEEVGYFSNRNLHAYEEADLGLKLIARGWMLKRIEIPAVKHYGYNTTSFGAFKKRWKSRYVKGSGEFLRSSFREKHFFKVAWHLKLYIGVIKWWIFLIIFLFTPWLQWYLLGTGVLLFLFLLKKKSIKEWVFSLISWHYSAVGLLWGFFSTQKDPQSIIMAKVIK